MKLTKLRFGNFKITQSDGVDNVEVNSKELYSLIKSGMKYLETFQLQELKDDIEDVLVRESQEGMK